MNVTVNELMTVNPNTVTLGTTLQDALATMNGVGCRQLPIVDDEKLVGMITDRDLRLAIDTPALDQEFSVRAELLQEPVLNYMTTDLITISPDVSAQKAAEMLSLYKFGSLPVVDNDILVGILSVTDFLTYGASL